ncbi:hypothetical protein AB0436_28110 [Streptomyces sp. NPDC051322]|uniref:hypothetical protein n=1 Tax=Streptomyces sp. NPDC051322 TaxID=3154645 RepID=UPI0034504C7A
MLATHIGIAVWSLAAAAISKGAVRVILGVLAAQAAHKALKTSAAFEAAHRLEVLRALLSGLKPPWRGLPGDIDDE